MIVSNPLANASVRTWAVLALTVFALLLFTSKRIPLETSSLSVFVVILMDFAVFPYEINGPALPVVAFYSEFGHEVLIAACALTIIWRGVSGDGRQRLPFKRHRLTPIVNLEAGF